MRAGQRRWHRATNAQNAQARNDSQYKRMLLISVLALLLQSGRRESLTTLTEAGLCSGSAALIATLKSLRRYRSCPTTDRRTTMAEYCRHASRVITVKENRTRKHFFFLLSISRLISCPVLVAQLDLLASSACVCVYVCVHHCCDSRCTKSGTPSSRRHPVRTSPFVSVPCVFCVVCDISDEKMQFHIMRHVADRYDRVTKRYHT